MSNPVQLNLADIYRELMLVKRQIGGGGGGTTFVPTTPTTPPPTQPQAANQFRNGSFSHSVGSWANVATADDRRYECAWWFAHPNTTNFPLSITDTVTTGAKTFVDANVTPATDNINITAHGFLTSDAVKFSTTGVLPAGIVAGTEYYIIRIDADNIKLAISIANALAGTPVLDITGAAGGGTHTVRYTNYSLKSSAHALYLSSQTNWSRETAPAGVARINSGSTLDIPLVQPSGEPSYVLFAAFNIAKKNQYVYAPVGARITCGMYGRQNGVWDYLNGAFAVTALVSGTVTTPTSRDYRVHTRTSRGFTVQTPTTTVASAPSDTDFSNGARVILSWQKPLQYGVLGYDIYRLTGATYKLLGRVESGLTTYIDNNAFLPDVVSAYPTADFTKLQAYTATSDSVLATLATDGVDANWDTLPFAIKVPANYNHSLTDFTRYQWVRWNITGLTGGRFDMRVTDGVTNSTEIVTSAVGQFNAGMVGKTMVITAKEGTHTAAIASYTSPTEVGLGLFPVSFSSTEAELVVEGGADVNSVYIDLAHLSFGENAIFGFHPDDLNPSRGVPPVAANGSNQGGTIILPEIPPPGGDGDGSPRCVWIEELVTVTDGSGLIFQIKAEELKNGMFTFFQNEIGIIAGIEYGVADIWSVETANGFVAHTSDTHKYLDDPCDLTGLPLAMKPVGSPVFTSIDGRGEVSTIIKREMIQKSGVVVRLKMSHTHRFLIGTLSDKCRKWGGIGSHNTKPREIDRQ